MRFEKRISQIDGGKRYNIKVLYPETPPSNTPEFNTESGFWPVNDQGEARKN
jgi:hypothetical protein